MKNLFSLLAMLFFCVSANAQNIQDLSFIAGKWKASMEWGELEEYWSEPMGNCMMCTFRCVNKGKVMFYEFIVIEQDADSLPVMKLRHFNPGNIAWEDKEHPYHYPLTKLERNKARFESTDKKTTMTFTRIGAEKLTVVLERTNKEGQLTTDTFQYTLTPP